MKFDLYNESTWNIDTSLLEKEMNNKGTGHMGQKIPIIREIREALTNKFDGPDTPEFRIATTLRERHPEAFQIMGVVIKCEDEAVSEYVMQCDHILITWDSAKTQEEKYKIWRDLIPYFKDLKKFFPNETMFSKETVENLLSKHLFKFTIEGNKAWEAYLKLSLEVDRLEKHSKYLHSESQRLYNELHGDDDDPESHDPPSSDDRPDSDINYPPNSRSYRD